MWLLTPNLQPGATGGHSVWGQGAGTPGLQGPVEALTQGVVVTASHLRQGLGARASAVQRLLQDVPLTRLDRNRLPF